MGGVVAGQVDVRERQQRREQLLIRRARVDVGYGDERSVGLRDTGELGLEPAHLARPVETSVRAGGLEPVAAEGARVVAEGEGGDDEVALLQRADGCTDLLHDADELVPHGPAQVGLLHGVVRVKVGTAYAGSHDPHDRVGGLLDGGVGDGLDAHVAGSVHERGLHESFVSVGGPPDAGG